jgi:hypothetical protein
VRKFIRKGTTIPVIGYIGYNNQEKSNNKSEWVHYVPEGRFNKSVNIMGFKRLKDPNCRECVVDHRYGRASNKPPGESCSCHWNVTALMEDHIWSSRKRGKAQEEGEYFSEEEEARFNNFKLLTGSNSGRLMALRDIKVGEQLQ